MRIVYAANVRLPTERAHGLQIMEMCRAFAQEGHDVRLVVPKRRNRIAATPWEHYGMRPTFEIVEVPIFDFIRYDGMLGKLALWLNALWFSLAAKRAVRTFAPDVIYARDPWFFGLDPRARYVFEAHDFPARAASMHRRAWSRAARIVTVTEGLKRAFVAAGVPETKIVVAHDGVDVAKFDVPETKAEARAKLGEPTEGFIAVYTGHLYPYKGADDLLEACAHLRTASRVLFVGGLPDDLARLKARAAALGVKNAVFVGPVPHARVPLYLRAADAAVLPTRASDRHAAEFLSPLKLFEYLAAGKALIATDTPSVREVLDDRSAVFVPPSDPAALARALNDLADVPAKREALEREAALLAVEHSWKSRAVHVLEGLPEPHALMTWFKRNRTALLFGLLAFAIRAAYVVFFPQKDLAGSDAITYLNIADVVRGAPPTFDERVPEHYQPLYPWMLAALKTFFGTSLLWIRLFQAALSAATVSLISVMARDLVSGRAERYVGTIGALYVPMILETGIIYTETLYAFLLTTSAFLLVRYVERPRFVAALWTGVALSAAGLVREIGFYLAFALSVLAGVLKRPRLLATVMLLPIFIAMLGLAVRSARISASTEVTHLPLMNKGYEQTFDDPNSRRFMTRWALYPEGVWRFLRYPDRLSDIGDGTYSTKQALRSGLTPETMRQWPTIFAKLIVTALHWLLIALAVYGLWRGRLSRRNKIILCAFIGFAAATIIVGGVARLTGFEDYEPLARYRFPVEPLILLLSAAGIDRLMRERI